MEDKLEIELRALKELFIEKFDRNSADHEKIIEQTTKTNGSVAKANVEINKLKVWHGYLKGALAVVMCFIIPIAIALLKVLIEK